MVYLRQLDAASNIFHLSSVPVLISEPPSQNQNELTNNLVSLILHTISQSEPQQKQQNFYIQSSNFLTRSTSLDGQTFAELSETKRMYDTQLTKAIYKIDTVS